MSKLRALTLVSAAGATLTAAGPARAQERALPLTAEVALSDFGVADPAAILRGRVSVVDAPEGARLEVHFLSVVAAPRTAAAVGAGVGGSGGTVAAGVAPPIANAKPQPPSPSGSAAGPPPAGSGPGASPSVEPLAALWVWTTAELLADSTARADFLELVNEQGIDRVFLQLIPGAGLVTAAGFVPFDGAVLGPLVADLRARGALTYALDGDPAYVLQPNHAGVRRTIERVAAHNRAAPPEQRFSGVRYDVEPYLLPGFQGPRRGQLLSDYLALLDVLSTAARAADLRLGVDIPFWLDGVDEVSGEPFDAELGGRRVPVLGRVLELVDDVALMAYRTTADGPDGVLAHTGGELAAAPREGVDVFVGIETTPLPDERLYSFRGPGRAGVPTNPVATWVVLQRLGDDRAKVWLVEGAAALQELRASAAADPDAFTYWFGGTPVPLTGDRLSFSSLGPEAMRRVAGDIVEGLRTASAFRGLAYHDYSGLRALLLR